MNIDLEAPYLAPLGNGWANGDLADPKTKVFIAVDIPAFHFNKHVKMMGYFSFPTIRNPNVRDATGRLWWEDGMQSEVVNTVQVFSDNPKEGVYCGYAVMNDFKYFLFLGRLKDKEEFTEFCREKLMAYDA